MQIIDAHTHFFSYTWFEQFYLAAKNRFENISDIAKALNWELPSKNPMDLGKKWIAEQDKHKVSKQILFASKLDDAEFLASATNAFPSRLAGFVMINPNSPDARNETHYALNVLGMKGILLFPALHHFRANDDNAYTIYDEALSASAPVFIHFGQLSIPVFQKLGLSDNIDLKYSTPVDLTQPAADIPDVNFIVPHFGCGAFEAALKLASNRENVYFDTSSSNSWIQSPDTLESIFQKAVQELGAERILFGTDSSFFPRGWRKDIFDAQLEILTALNLSKKEKELILGGNISRIAGL